MNRYFRTALIGALSLIIGVGNSSGLAAQGNPPQTPFGPVPAPPAPSLGLPLAPSPFQAGPAPNPPQAPPDDVSELQKCYKALSDPETCRRVVAEQANWEVRFFDVKYATPSTLADALSIFRASVRVSPGMRLLSVKAPKEIMPAIEDAIKRLDVAAPKKSVELTLHILSASDQSGTPPSGVPQSLQPVVNQLKNVFSYKQFQLVDTLVLTGVDGQTVQSNGILPGYAFSQASTGARTNYTLQAPLLVRMADQKDPILRLGGERLDAFRFGLRVPVLTGNSSGPVVPFQYSDIGINTWVEVQQGQQVVVGKATVGDSAVILVLSVKFP